MPNMTKAQAEAWLRSRAGARLNRTIPEWSYTVRPDWIYVSHEVKGGLNLARSYYIPALIDKVLSRTTLDTGGTARQRRDAMKAAVPNPSLAALLDELVP